MNYIKIFFLFFFLKFVYPLNCFAQVGTNHNDRAEQGRPITTYTLVIDASEKTLAGVRSKHAMTINGQIPGPVLNFTEGDLAVINVINRLEHETSIHWHGLILPNLYDGVPYLNTPPILSGDTFQYRIPINQAGTYWYHSHTMFQEQKGVYGGIVIQPKSPTIDYDKELVIVLSDWTNENPKSIYKNLKRGNEWYQIAKGTAVPLNEVFKRNAFKAQLKFWKDRMEGADIADVFYPAFLANGKSDFVDQQFKPGEKVRVRFINAAASSYFWLDFGTSNVQVIASDGVRVKPYHKERLLFGVAETYDFIVTMPDGAVEIVATAQDGSGYCSMQLGSGNLHKAKVIERPDKIGMMKSMAELDMRMGAPTIQRKLKKRSPKWYKHNYGMQMASMNMDDTSSMKMMMHETNTHNSSNTALTFNYKDRKKFFNYNHLESDSVTSFDDSIPRQKIELNLTGNMNLYLWSMNGKPISEEDRIRLKQNHVTQITFTNLTMMHHPMHLHGHYFRVLNDAGTKSPLKHTVNIPPMGTVTIEFLNEEYGEWFFHCHILYHMMGGMARIMSYNPEINDSILSSSKPLVKETNHFYNWSTLNASSNFTEFRFVSSNTRNLFDFRTELDYQLVGESEIQYNRFLNDWFRIYTGINVENESKNSLNDLEYTGLLGFKYFTPFMFNLDVSVDHMLRTRIRLDREVMLFPRLVLEGELEYISDFKLIESNENEALNYSGSLEWLTRLSYFINKNISLQANYHNHYGFGAGLTVRF